MRELFPIGSSECARSPENPPTVAQPPHQSCIRAHLRARDPRTGPSSPRDARCTFFSRAATSASAPSLSPFIRQNNVIQPAAIFRNSQIARPNILHNRRVLLIKQMNHLRRDAAEIDKIEGEPVLPQRIRGSKTGLRDSPPFFHTPQRGTVARWGALFSPPLTQSALMHRKKTRETGTTEDPL